MNHENHIKQQERWEQIIINMTNTHVRLISSELFAYD